MLSGGRGRAEEKEKRMGNGKKRLGKEGMDREEEKGGRGEEKITVEPRSGQLGKGPQLGKA